MKINELFWLMKNDNWEPDTDPREEEIGEKLDDLLQEHLPAEAFYEAETLVIELTDIHEEMAFEKGFRAAVGLLAGSIESYKISDLKQED